MRDGIVFASVVLTLLLSGVVVHGEQFLVSGAACEVGRAAPDGLFTMYWEALDLTEVCVRLDVRIVSGSRGSLSLVAVLKGRSNGRQVVSLLARAHSSSTIGAASFRPPRFVLIADGFPIDLTASGRPHQVVYPCDQSESGCAYDGIVSLLREGELFTLARAESISAQALGTTLELTSTGRAAVRALASRLARR